MANEFLRGFPMFGIKKQVNAPRVNSRYTLGLTVREALWSAAACCRFRNRKLASGSVTGSMPAQDGRQRAGGRQSGSKLPHSKAAQKP